MANLNGNEVYFKGTTLFEELDRLSEDAMRYRMALYEYAETFAEKKLMEFLTGPRMWGAGPATEKGSKEKANYVKDRIDLDAVNVLSRMSSSAGVPVPYAVIFELVDKCQTRNDPMENHTGIYLAVVVHGFAMLDLYHENDVDAKVWFYMLQFVSDDYGWPILGINDFAGFTTFQNYYCEWERPHYLHNTEKNMDFKLKYD